MNNTEDKKRILSEMSMEAALFRCGELQLSYEDTSLLLSKKTDPNQLLQDLDDPESEAFRIYHEGVAEGKLILMNNLEYNVGDPKAKDAYKNLSNERKRQMVNKTLNRLFGIPE